MDYIYQVNLTANGAGGFIASFPDIAEAITEGKDKAEALANAREALGLALRARCADREALPAAVFDRGIAVAPDAWDTLKLAALAAFKQAGISKTELARRLGKKEAEARRILDPFHASKLQILEAALAVLGKQAVISIKDAA